MSGDFSRITFRPERHYRAVLLQQGRVTVDADPNEQADIVEHRARETAADVIGSPGRPKGEFAVTVDNGNLRITRGTLYLGGTAYVNDGECTLTSQPFLPLDAATVPAFPDLAAGAGTYAVYLRGFERILTAVEDPEMRETALGGADTSVRVQTVWQVRLRRFDPPAGATCGSVGETWRSAFVPGRMTARTVAVDAGQGACVLPPAAEYRRLENQLYRVEIHRGGTRAQATFKWSRENGSILTSVVRANPGDVQTGGPVLRVESTGRDADSGFANDQWVELLDDRAELTPTVAPLSKIDAVRAATREIELESAGPTVVFDRHPKLRRWDHPADAGSELGIPVGAQNDIPIEDGIVVTFSEGDYRPGDYWLIPARTAISAETGRIEWPTVNGVRQPLPSRMKEESCLLTVVRYDGQSLQAVAGFAQCVPEFPPLTAIQAGDVGYAPGCVPLENARTVQDAIDQLCRLGGGCTVVVRPGAGWEQPIVALAADAHAEICFPVGEFPTPRGGVVIEGKGHLRISGAGRGTRIVNEAGESALRFVSCTSVLVRDIEVVARAIGSAELNGAITCLDCSSVELQSVRVESADGSRPQCAALTVRYDGAADATSASPSLRVRGCTIVAGEQQYGILGVNLVRAHVEDNVIVCNRVRRVRSLDELQSHRFILAEVTRQLASKIRVLAGRQPAAGDVVVSVGEVRVAFSSHPLTRGGWPGYLQANPPAAGARPDDVIRHIVSLRNRLATDRRLWGQFPAVEDLFRRYRELPVSALRGVCLAGSRLQEARIADNSIRFFRTGIHVALSHRETAAGAPDSADDVAITGNRVEVHLLPGDEGPPTAAGRPRGPHGIYVGNARNVTVANNHLTVNETGPQRAQVGVLMHGHFGPRIVVRENRLDGFRLAVRIAHESPPPPARLWTVVDNVCYRCTTLAEGELNPPGRFNAVSAARA